MMFWISKGSCIRINYFCAFKARFANSFQQYKPSFSLKKKNYCKDLHAAMKGHSYFCCWPELDSIGVHLLKYS